MIAHTMFKCLLCLAEFFLFFSDAEQLWSLHIYIPAKKISPPPSLIQKSLHFKNDVNSGSR